MTFKSDFFPLIIFGTTFWERYQSHLLFQKVKAITQVYFDYKNKQTKRKLQNNQQQKNSATMMISFLAMGNEKCMV